LHLSFSHLIGEAATRPQQPATI